MKLIDLSHDISDYEGELRDVTGIIKALNKFRGHMNTHAMSDHRLYLQGRVSMIEEVIDFLESV